MPERQRYRCVDPARKFHRFTPLLSRQVTGQGICDTCESKVGTHQGPVIGRRYAIPLREVAAAFVAVGQGASYAGAADRARGAAGRPRLGSDRGGQLVAEWLDVLAPVVLKATGETQWPSVLILDSTRFMDSNPHLMHPQMAFNVLAAYGYPDLQTGPNKGARVWALMASHNAGIADWERFLRQLDITIPPELIIADGAQPIAQAIRKVWPLTVVNAPPIPRPFIFRCEYHLANNALEKIRQDLFPGLSAAASKSLLANGNALTAKLKVAFRDTAGWNDFTGSLAGYPLTQAWVASVRKEVSDQVAVRHLLKDHRTTSAIEVHIGKIRDFLDSRTFVLRNRDRLNQTLGLIRLHLNRTDHERAYLNWLRQALEDGNGWAPKQRTKADNKWQIASLRR